MIAGLPALQLDVFDMPAPETTRPAHAPYQRDSEPSREAALIAAGRITHRHRAILRQAYEREHGSPRGITRKDVERVQSMSTQTACPRLNALEEAKKLRKLYTLINGEAHVVVRERCSVYVLGSKFTVEDLR